MNGAAGAELPLADVALLPPVDGLMEVWAAGVTYERSRDARVEESAQKDVYTRVYDARRPEVFFKAPAWRAVTNDEPIGVRVDSELDVPEAELAVVAAADGVIVGYTVCDDVSSRSIEGDNPLYLPQAKVYAGSCALAAGIRPAWEIARPEDLRIEVAITRDDQEVWSATTSTAAMRRRPADLVAALFDHDRYPDGLVLSTGTGVVPPMDVALRPGDQVTITIDEVGTLANPVASGVGAFAFLVDRART